MYILQFMSDSPFLSFFLAVVIYWIIVAVCVTLPNRILRHLSIRKHGWPPAHCDAGGYFLQEEKEETVNNKPHCDDYSFQDVKITTKE